MLPPSQNPGPVPAGGGGGGGHGWARSWFPLGMLFRCCSLRAAPQQTLSPRASPNQRPLPTALPVLSIPVSHGPIRTPLPWGLRPWSQKVPEVAWAGRGGGLTAPVPAPEPSRALHALPAALAWCPQAFAELVQGHVLAESKLLCSPRRVSPGPWRWQQELNVSATGPLATTASHSHPSWWTRTSATRSKQQRGGPGDRTGWAVVTERVCIAPHPPSSASPCGGTIPEPNSLGVGCPGTPRAPGEHRGARPEDGPSLRVAPGGFTELLG